LDGQTPHTAPCIRRGSCRNDIDPSSRSLRTPFSVAIGHDVFREPEPAMNFFSYSDTLSCSVGDPFEKGEGVTVRILLSVFLEKKARVGYSRIFTTQVPCTDLVVCRYDITAPPLFLSSPNTSEWRCQRRPRSPERAQVVSWLRLLASNLTMFFVPQVPNAHSPLGCGTRCTVPSLRHDPPTSL
jgi:hypothetical protein